MCRLYAGEGKRQKKRTRIDVSHILDEEEVELISESARQHREWQRKQGDAVNYTEADEIRWAVKKYLDELRENKKNSTADTLASSGAINK